MLESWQAEGRAGRPRFVGVSYYGLGLDATERIKPYVLDYYRYFGPSAELLPPLIPTMDEAVQARIRSLTEIGADELVLWPCIAELEQIELLAALVA